MGVCVCVCVCVCAYKFTYIAQLADPVEYLDCTTAQWYAPQSVFWI